MDIKEILTVIERMTECIRVISTIATSEHARGIGSYRTNEAIENTAIAISEYAKNITLLSKGVSE